MDYITLNGIRDRTGFDGEDLYEFIIRELVANAIDYLEKKHSAITTTSNHDIPKVMVSISTDYKTVNITGRNYKYLKLKVQNTIIASTKDANTPIFTFEILRSIFNFDSFFSSNRNQYKITRGALGDALKEIICIPYAIAKEYYNIEWNEPLIISSGKQRFSIILIVDRINQKIEPSIVQNENANRT